MSSNIVSPTLILFVLCSLTALSFVPFGQTRIAHISAAFTALYLFGSTFSFNDIFTACHRAKLFVRISSNFMIEHKSLEFFEGIGS
jgi:hypothetical protein